MSTALNIITPRSFAVGTFMPTFSYKNPLYSSSVSKASSQEKTIASSQEKTAEKTNHSVESREATKYLNTPRPSLTLNLSNGKNSIIKGADTSPLASPSSSLRSSTSSMLSPDSPSSSSSDENSPTYGIFEMEEDIIKRNKKEKTKRESKESKKVLKSTSQNGNAEPVKTSSQNGKEEAVKQVYRYLPFEPRKMPMRNAFCLKARNVQPLPLTRTKSFP